MLLDDSRMEAERERIYDDILLYEWISVLDAEFRLQR